jgi:pyruvate/2-oxoacid:ferredoxin oxidoreductase beta subunit
LLSQHAQDGNHTFSKKKSAKKMAMSVFFLQVFLVQGFCLIIFLEQPCKGQLAKPMGKAMKAMKSNVRKGILKTNKGKSQRKALGKGKNQSQSL